MISKILIANRGEIAVRIIKTCRKLNITSIAIYSDIDKNSLFVKMADESYSLNGISATDTYLNIPKILNIAKQAGADAVHPGYGFLSENAGFAEQVAKAGIKFIGPKPEAISAMGLKSTAKKIMQTSGVAVLPGYNDAENSEERLLKEASTIGYPLLIKATAGGGGKGMRVVNQAAELVEAIRGAKREAKKSFANDDIILEKYLANPRHVEVQVLCDSHGNAVYLYERDCSMQRRYQKVIEEAPAPNIDSALRKKLGEQAVLAAKAINYEGAGTIEFLLDDADKHQFYFMEMNTRLQVEHPVTEMITGLDLVELQIKVANGEKLELQQDEIKIDGVALEARIYAEDVHNKFLPASGVIKHLDFGQLVINYPQTFRIDSGIQQADNIDIYYDPMLAKVIARGRDRKQAIENLTKLLKDINLVGFKTNSDFLISCLQHKDFQSAKLSTNFINNHINDLLSTTVIENIPDPIWLLAGIYYNFYGNVKTNNAHMKALEPWLNFPNFRLNLHNTYSIKLNSENLPANVTNNLEIECLTNNFSVITIKLGEKIYTCSNVAYSNDILQFDGQDADGVLGKQQAKIIFMQEKLYINYGGKKYILNNKIETGSGAPTQHQGALNAPMHGTIIAINVNAGSKVLAGEALVILEAMKMEHVIVAPREGIIANVNYKQGEQVAEGAELLVMQ